MPRPKRLHRTVTCKIEEIEAKMDAMASEQWELLNFAVVQVGIGFGARVDAYLIFKRKGPAQEAEQ